ncbi:MAG: NAD(+) synthase, partial [Firmicutes bacterium]|nr:NAD(+) synthase [Bacillota bacterium]
VSPGANLCLAGAQIICCPSSDHEVGGSFRARRNQIRQTSASGLCGYLYAASGAGESTADLVHTGSCLAAECGKLLSDNHHFLNENVVNFADFDLQFIALERNRARTFETGAGAYCDREAYAIVECGPLTLLEEPVETLFRPLPQMAFLPEDSTEAMELYSDIFDLQTAALVKRMQHTHAKTAVIGVSGGLDSTLALLVIAQAFKQMHRDPKDIIAVTMPGFGTTDHTYQNALTIMELLGTTVREVPIRDAVLQHFKDIGHDPAVHDTTYENAQARERTQILMDISNKEGGLVIGTGDLSEMTLGWCTYNGDHMSMYGVNGGVPKTMIRFIIGRFMDRHLGGFVPTGDAGEAVPVDLYSADDLKLKEALQSILDTPISPELLPPDESGNIAQKTEDSVGPYILHDFFIYHTLRCGASPRKLLALAVFAFRGTYDRAFIKKWMTVFYRRFFNQQFKRNCVPDGPKIGTVGLSPRGDWRMPSDAEAALWLQEVEAL